MKSFTSMYLLLVFTAFSLPAQKTLFKSFSDRYSYGFGINPLKNGHYLIAGLNGDPYRAFGAEYDSQGQIVWEDTLCNCFGPSLHGRELENGKWLFVSYSGTLVLLDVATKKADSLITLNIPGVRNYFIDKIRVSGKRLYLLGTAQFSQKSLSVLFKLTLDSLQASLVKTYPESTYARDFAVYSDGSLLEFLETAFGQILQKTDPTGVTQWMTPFRSGITFYSDLFINKQDEIYLAGTVQDTMGLYSGILHRFDSNGNFIYRKKYSPNTGNYKSFRRITEDASGDLLIAGSDGQVIIGPISEAALTKLNTDGEVLWEIREEIKFEGNEALDFLVDADGNIVLTGIAGDSDFAGPQRAFIWKVSPLTIDAKQAEWPSINLTPNPASDDLILNAQEPIPECQITLYNMEGKSLYQERISRFPHSIDIRNWNEGLYFCKISNAEGARTLRWVKSSR